MVVLSAGGIFARVRQPEYTGKNRCIPCTLTNVVIAVVLSVVVGYASILVGVEPVVGAGISAGVLFVSGLSIYLRGYLVPGTPTLTKRYFPDWLLAKFDKLDDEEEGTEQTATGTDVDVETTLLEADVLEPRPHGDLGLTDRFADALFEQIEIERDGETERDALANIVGVESDALTFESYGDGAFVAVTDEQRIGNWESRAAFLADAAAGRLLPGRVDDWEEASPAVRGQLLAGLRLFLEQCPACDGPVRFGQEVVESCCRTHDVVAVTCEECDARLFEVQASEELLTTEVDSPT